MTTQEELDQTNLALSNLLAGHQKGGHGNRTWEMMNYKDLTRRKNELIDILDHETNGPPTGRRNL